LTDDQIIAANAVLDDDDVIHISDVLPVPHYGTIDDFVEQAFDQRAPSGCLFPPGRRLTDLIFQFSFFT
jgi:hypothetical protein